MKKILNRIFHISGLLCLLILPIGYYGNESDSTQLVLGAYGSSGQVATVVRDCSGHALASEVSAFREASWSAHMIPGRSLPLVFGVRGGYYLINARFPVQIVPGTDGTGPQYASSATVTLKKWYYIPEISLETRNFGLGLGVVLGHVPFSFSDVSHSYDLDDAVDGTMPVSGHIRLGDPDKAFFMASLTEGNPILLDGIFDVGIGYRVSPAVRMFSAFSGLFYDRGGLLQKVNAKIGRHAELYGSFRVGGADGKFEGGASMGLIFILGKRP